MKVSLTLTLVLFASITLVYSESIQSTEYVFTRGLAPIDELGNLFEERTANNANNATTPVISFIVVRDGEFGLSPGDDVKGLAESDIMIESVNDTDKRSYFSERLGVDKSEPVLDPNQNYELTSVLQNTTSTLGIQRPNNVTGDTTNELGLIVVLILIVTAPTLALVIFQTLHSMFNIFFGSRLLITPSSQY